MSPEFTVSYSFKLWVIGVRPVYFEKSFPLAHKHFFDIFVNVCSGRGSLGIT